MILFLIFVFIFTHSFTHANPRSSEVQNLVASSFPYRIDTPRKLVAEFTPYKLNDNITSEHICHTFHSWQATTSGWDKKLNPHKLTLCSKDYGGDGNCLFHVISGILKDNGYKIGHFNLDRKDISPGIKMSLAHMNLKNDESFSMKDIRTLASLCYVGVNPEIKDAHRYLDVEQLKVKIQMTILALDASSDIKWNPEDCLTKLNDTTANPIDIAKHIYKSLCSTNPVKSWGSGDDLYGLCELLNVDFLVFHKDGERIQHFMSSHKKPSAGVVANFMNSDTRKLSSSYPHFELDDKLYDLLPTKKVEI